MTPSTVQSDYLSSAFRWRDVAVVLCMTAFVFAMPLCSAQQATPKAELFTGTRALESLQRPRSVTLQAVPLLDAITNLQNRMQYAIILDRRIDPRQPITLATGLVNSKDVLRQVAEAAKAKVVFADGFAVVGPAESVSKLRTVMELRRNEVRSLRSKLGPAKYQSWFDEVGAGWPNLMQPQRFVVEQIQMAKATPEQSAELPHDLWRAQQLPALNLIQRLSIVLNQFDQTFRIEENSVVKLVPVEENPTVRRRFRVPNDRREAVEALLQRHQPSADATWSGSRMTLRGRVELMEAVESAIRNKTVSNNQQGLKTQLFSMSIPAGSTIFRVVESLKASGVTIRIQGLNLRRREEYLQTKIQMDAERMPGAEFFPALLKADGGTVKVEQDFVLIQF